jgi:hypothetical protein
MLILDSLYIGEKDKAEHVDVLKTNKIKDTRSKTSQIKPTPIPTAPPRPDPENKRQVQWFEDTHYYALKASNDDRFRIRHAPIPAPGTPWPMPQVYQPSDTVFHVDPQLFRIYPIGENCDILEHSFKRILKNTFLDYNVDDVGSSRRSGFLSGSLFALEVDDETFSQSIVMSLNVTILKECDGAVPHLEMDESCKYHITIVTHITVYIFLIATEGMLIFSYYSSTFVQIISSLYEL